MDRGHPAVTDLVMEDVSSDRPGAVRVHHRRHCSGGEHPPRVLPSRRMSGPLRGRRRGRVAIVASAAFSVAACSVALDFEGLDTRTADGIDAGADAPVAVEAASEGGERDVAADAARGGYAATVLDSAPRAYWRFGESGGPRAVDETGRAHGTYLGTPILGVDGALPGDPSTAWRTEGARGGMSAGPGFGFPATAPFTLEVWIRPALVDAEFRMIFLRRSVDAKGRHEYAVYFHDGRVVFVRYIDDARLATSATGPPSGEWQHVAATYDGTTLALYLGGALAGSVADARPMVDAPAELLVGAANATATPFVGTLDEAAVYDVALSSGQVRAHVESARRAR
jgi:hypothetical protein